MQATALSLSWASVALAAEAADAAEAPGGRLADDDIVVTGTRATDRTRLDAVSPVDVLKSDRLSRRGLTETAAGLAELVPSITFPRSVFTGGTGAIRPVSFRGLAPDQALVLVNGSRGHSSALLNVSSSAVGRGSAAVDLNTIPSVALDRIEVLRDGASAQYGSDAIAGVLNIRLRGADHGGGATVTYGVYDTHIPVFNAPRDANDGQTVTVSAWQGLKLGDGGFLTLSGEFVGRSSFNRADVDRRLAKPAIVSTFGDGRVNQWTGWANAELPLGDTWALYGWAGYQKRKTRTADVFRPTAAVALIPAFVDKDAVTAIYPNGYAPSTLWTTRDLNSALGLRGDLGGWKSDLTLSYGRNRIDINTSAVNSTYGADTPTRFYAGSLIYDQWLASEQVSRVFELGAESSLNVAGGIEFRREGFRIIAGQHESWDRGPLGSNSNLNSGSLGFGGFLPSNQVDVHRNSFSAYLDFEARLANLTLGAAGRFEHYAATGENATVKASARYDFSPAFALRATVSTGFRAPSLQQQYYTSTASSQIVVGNTVVSQQTGIFPSISPVAKELGGQPLRPEKSTNFSAGAVLRLGNFSATVDAYHIRIRDQLTLSEQIASPLLAPLGVAQARFFINGITSTTQGVDVVTTYSVETTGAGKFDLSAAFNYNDITIDKAPASNLFGIVRRISLEDATPQYKAVGTVDWTLGKFGLYAQATYYSSISQAQQPTVINPTGKKLITNLSARFEPSKRINFTIGADNVFDVYPDRANHLTGSHDGLGTLPFPFFSPFGFGGRYLYARIGVNW